jgi:hypothetical protein
LLRASFAFGLAGAEAGNSAASATIAKILLQRFMFTPSASSEVMGSETLRQDCG